MFLKCSTRQKDGKEHRSWSVVESRRVGRGVVQRHGLMPRVVFEKLATLQLVDVCVPTTDGRELLLVRRTEPERDVALLLARLKLELPPQSPPRISGDKVKSGATG